MPQGCIFADKGPAIFVDGDKEDELLSHNALLNSEVFRYLVKVQLARTELAQSYEVGLIQQTPFPKLTQDTVAILASLAKHAWSLKRSLNSNNETSHAFLLPAGLNAEAAKTNRGYVERELAIIQKKINDAAYALYGIGPAEHLINEEPPKNAVTTNASEEGEEFDNGDDDNEDEASVDVVADALNSWLVSVAFGRFDPRLATGERSVPPEPKPFDPLPLRSPGMWPEGEGAQQCPDILVDDEGHVDDLVALMRVAAERVRIDPPENLRAWLAKEFFSLHIKMYSKSRRKAPIYWQLATPSASYSVWLYIHSFTKDTLFRVSIGAEK